MFDNYVCWLFPNYHIIIIIEGNYQIRVCRLKARSMGLIIRCVFGVHDLCILQDPASSCSGLLPGTGSRLLFWAPVWDHTSGFLTIGLQWIQQGFPMSLKPNFLVLNIDKVSFLQDENTWPRCTSTLSKYRAATLNFSVFCWSQNWYFQSNIIMWRSCEHCVTCVDVYFETYNVNLAL